MRKHDVFYFAYGSNMAESEMKRRGKCPGAVVRGTAYILNKKRVFNKRRGKWGVPANIIKVSGTFGYGVLYELADETECETLDRAENGYSRIDVRVRVLPDRRIFDAVTYEAEPEAVVDEGPTEREYRGLLLKGAREHNLPEDYILSLESVSVAKEQL